MSVYRETMTRVGVLPVHIDGCFGGLDPICSRSYAWCYVVLGLYSLFRSCLVYSTYSTYLPSTHLVLSRYGYNYNYNYDHEP